MTRRDEIAKLREKYFREPSSAQTEVQLRDILDFLDLAVRALEEIVLLENEFDRRRALTVLPKLDEEVT